MIQTAFIHIPKTAGTSIERNVASRCGGYQDRKRHDLWDPTVPFTNLGHVSAGALLKCGHLTQEWWDASFRFAFVRNPWDRVVSLYSYYTGFRLKRKHRGSNQCLVDFQAFVREITSGTSKYVKPIGLRPVHDLSQANSQLDWLRWGVDYVGRFETLEEDWEELCGILELEHTPLTKTRISKRKKDYRGYYNDELAELVGSHFRPEIERFGYKYG